MNKTLHLLVTSERPDTYLNSVAHCILNEGVTEVVFLYVHGVEDGPERAARAASTNRSATVARWVTSMAEDLAAGEYRYYVGDKARTKVDLRQICTSEQIAAMQQIYRQLLESRIHWDHRDIRYSDLRKEISAIAIRKPPAIVDVTSVKKTFLGDLVAASIIEGLDSLYTFDLSQRPDFDQPWSMLYHALKDPSASESKYKYTNLLETPIFRDCSRSLLVRRPYFRVAALLSILLFTATFGAYFLWGSSSELVQGTFVLSSVASIVSLLFNLFSPKL
jgi:hypothetical protein